MYIRIIPRLDIKGPNLVKGINFEGLRVLGRPEQFAKFYYENGADELFYQDAVASLYGRNSLLEIIKKTSKEIFIPLCVGGGLRSVEDIREVLRAGADKVAVNTAAVQNPDLIKKSARAFGSSTIIVSIEAIRHENGKYEVCVNYGRDHTGIDALKWAKKVVELGAGELIVTSIEKEGTGEGYDLELTRKISEAVDVPVIACGGCGCIEHVSDVIQYGKADAVSMASILHYYVIENKKLNIEESSFKDEGNILFLTSGSKFKKINVTTIMQIKQHLINEGIPCRVDNI